MWYLQTMEHSSASQKKEMLEDIMLGENSQTPNDKYCVILLVSGNSQTQKPRWERRLPGAGGREQGHSGQRIQFQSGDISTAKYLQLIIQYCILKIC